MIKLLGIKRLMTLLMVIAVAAVLAAIQFLWIAPASMDANNQVNGLNGEIGTLQNNIATVKEQIQETRENIPYYDRLKTVEFFSVQDRFAAQRVISGFQQESGIASAEFTIGQLVDVNEPMATEIEYRLAVSPIQIESIQAYTDLDFYNLIYLMNNSFPGHIRIKNLELRRSANVDTSPVGTAPPTPNTDGPPRKPTFVTGDIEMQWLTMIEDPQDAPDALEGGIQ